MRAFVMLMAVAALLAILKSPTIAAKATGNDIYLQTGDRFTVVCTDGSELVYGDNGSGGHPVTGIAGFCE